MYLLCGILLFLFFASALAIAFSPPVLYEKEKKVNKVVPFNKNYTEVAKKELTNKMPRRDTNGVCIVCGLDRNAHGWECITYFMNLVSESFQENYQRVDLVLEDVEMGRPVSKLRAGIIRRSLKEAKEITDAIKKS